MENNLEIFEDKKFFVNNFNCKNVMLQNVYNITKIFEMRNKV